MIPLFLAGLFNKKRLTALSVLIFLVVAVSITVIFVVSSDQSTNLLEAYKIAHNEVLKWCGQAELALITSVDEPDSTPDDGKNGKRRNWNTIFADPASYDKQYIVTIHDKTAKVFPIRSQIDKTQFINMNNLTLTSEKAVSMAIKNYGLLPGQDWARGYHFTVQSFNDQIDFQVVGLSANQKMIFIAFDGKGNYLATLRPHG